MARGKKKETQTPEERLQAALVPESEQPYKVPENWCWVSLQTIDQYQSSTIDPSKQPETLFELYSVPSSANDYPEIVMGHEIGSTKQVVNKDDILLCKINPRINRVWKVSQHTENTLLASSEWIIVRNSKMVSDYLMYCFSAPYFREYMLSNVSGVGGSLMRAQPKYVKTYPIPVPPRSEQQRIVDRIKSLFAKLDEAKQKAQDAQDSVELRKAAILHKAFNGELTAGWRKEHSVGMENWTSNQLKDVTQIGSGGTPSRKNAQYYLGDILWVKTGEIYWNCIYDSEEKITEEAIADSSAKLYPAGTVLVAMYGQGLTRGRAAILGVPAATNQAVCALQPCDCLEKRFLYYYFMAHYWEYREKAVGGNQPNYSATMIGKWIINIPSVLEQSEIIRILDNLLAKEQQAKEATEKVLEQIDLIKKSILARAFRGELGTNNPKEESSISLLKEIIFSAPPKKVTSRSDKPVEVEIPIAIQKQLTTAVQEKVYRYVLENPLCTVEQVSVIEKNVLEAVQALRELEEKSLILRNTKDDTLTVVI